MHIVGFKNWVLHTLKKSKNLNQNSKTHYGYLIKYLNAVLKVDLR